MISDADIFADALALPLADRARFVAAACGADAAQRERLLALLLAHEKALVMLPTPLTPRPGGAVAEAGMKIGHYKLLEKIGEGGCGVVWMAQQDEPVRRRVALKVIKLGMDTQEVIARFEAERQALAMLDHPHIAKVFEAGATEAGRPYFAMELVRGLPITRYCDERELPTQVRLELFAQVCGAIQHAHQRGIVHRDLKPSNILVSHDGDEPQPKVIDFGIAKATDGRLTDKTLFTAFDQFIGTPAYMSPEQADFNTREVDARSDVYALGALLYELIAGRPPFDPKALASQGINEVRRILREVDPPRPSTQLTALAEAERTTLALRRGAAPLQHVLAVKGDLDWIAMKALEKNRDRRYPSAAALADDVLRHMQHKPVQARPPSIAYVWGKFVRRQRPLVMAGGIAVTALAVGGVASVAQARRAVRAEAESAQLAEKNRGSPLVRLWEAGRQPRHVPPAPASPEALVRARAFVADVRENYFHDSLLEVREDYVQERAEETLAVLDLLAAEARWPAWARDRGIVAARLALAERRQAKSIAAAHAGEARAALQALRAAGDTSNDATVLLAMAGITAFEPILQQRLYGHPEARKRVEALADVEALLLPLVLAGEGADRARHVLAEALLARGEYKTGEAATGFLTRALALIDEIAPEERSQPRVLVTRAKIVTQLGDPASPDENARRQQEVLAMAEAVLAQQPQSAAAQRLKFWANWSLGRGRTPAAPNLPFLTEAEKLAYALHQRDLSSDDDWYLVLIVRRQLAAYFTEVGRIADAAAVWHRTAVDGGHPAMLPEPPTGKARRFIKGVLQSTALLEASRGHAETAELAFQAQRQHPTGAKAGPEVSPRAALGLNSLTEVRQEVQFRLLRGDYDWVITHGQATLDQMRAIITGAASKADDRVLLQTTLDAVREAVAEALVQRRRFDEAEAMLVKTVELLPPEVAKATPYSATQQIWLALALARQNRGSEALKLLTPTLTALRRQWHAGSPRAEQRELLARGLLVEAVAQPATDEGRARRLAALEEAQKILDAMTDEARQLYAPRVLLKWIAEERAQGPGGVSGG